MHKKIRCKNCGQESSPIEGEGNWELSGKFEGNLVLKCKKCNAGLVLSLEDSSSKLISPIHMERLEKEKYSIIKSRTERNILNNLNQEPGKEKSSEEFNKPQFAYYEINGSKFLDYEILASNRHERNRVIKVKIIPILSTIISIIGLYYDIVFVFGIGIFLCLISMLLAYHWGTMKRPWMIIICIITSNLILDFLKIERGYLFTACYGILLWTAIHSLFQVFQILKIFILTLSYRSRNDS